MNSSHFLFFFCFTFFPLFTIINECCKAYDPLMKDATIDNLLECGAHTVGDLFAFLCFAIAFLCERLLFVGK